MPVVDKPTLPVNYSIIEQNDLELLGWRADPILNSKTYISMLEQSTSLTNKK